MNETIIEISGLSKDYETGFWRKKKVRALDGLNLDVEAGGVFGFLGGNGAGKTTTIKILMGLLFPTAGSAKILGREIDDVDMRREIGYSPENPYFYDYLTAAELIDYFGQIFGLDGSVRRRKTEELLLRVGLDEADWNKQLRKFSKGMLQRVSLAQALINDPKVVFLDEPMSGLDPIGRREVRELIESLRAAGTTVFMSTHILSDVEALCDRVAILRRGRLAATGTLTELLNESEGPRAFEILARDLNKGSIAGELPNAVVTDEAAGVSVEVMNEAEIDEALAAIRRAGGKLISVNPVRQSLEQLFSDPEN